MPSSQPSTSTVSVLNSLELSGRNRSQFLLALKTNPALQHRELICCSRDIFHWWNTFCWTYDPQKVGTELSAFLPFLLYRRQIELILWLEQRLADKEDGLLEKSRN